MQSNRKKILSVFLALILALGILPAPLTAAAAQTDAADVGDTWIDHESGDVDPAYPDYEYLVKNGGAEITYYNGDGGDITIPSALGGYPVTSIATFAPVGPVAVSLTSIVIPDTVKSIGAYAFAFSGNLKSVTIPDSVTSIGGSAFHYCTSLQEINIPDSVDEIGYAAFSSCESLKKIHLPDSLTTVECFYGCEALEEVNIPASCTVIGDGAFAYCRSLKTIDIPDTVTEIGGEAFLGCTSLRQVTIPASCEKIDMWAFRGCESLERIHIPASVTEIGEDAFRRYDGGYTEDIASREDALTSITVDPANTVYDSREDCSAIIETATDTLLYGCRNTVIPDTVTSINRQAFECCIGLEKLVIPDSVTEIGYDAFKGCTSLSSVALPASLTEIKSEAFAYCTSLKRVVIPDSVTEIGWLAFQGCTSLTSATIPDSVKEIGGYAFDGCPNLLSLTVPKSVETIGERAFGTEMSEVHEVYDDGGERTYQVCVPIEGFTLYGYYGTAAEKYAKRFADTQYTASEGEIPFVGINSAEANGKVVVIAPKNKDYSLSDVTGQEFMTPSGKPYDYQMYYPEGVRLLGVYEIKFWEKEEPADTAPDSASADEATPDEQTPVPVRVRIRSNCPDARVLRLYPEGFVGNECATYKDGWLTFSEYYGEGGVYVVAVGEDAEVLPCGDIDGDGEVSSLDVTRILRYCVSLNSGIDEAALALADVDGSGEVDIIDATLIQRHLAQMDTPYPIGQEI